MSIGMAGIITYQLESALTPGGSQRNYRGCPNLRIDVGNVLRPDFTRARIIDPPSEIHRHLNTKPRVLMAAESKKRLKRSLAAKFGNGTNGPEYAVSRC